MAAFHCCCSSCRCQTLAVAAAGSVAEATAMAVACADSDAAVCPQIRGYYARAQPQTVEEEELVSVVAREARGAVGARERLRAEAHSLTGRSPCAA